MVLERRSLLLLAALAWSARLRPVRAASSSDDEAEALARALFARLAKAHADVPVFAAHYVQTRRSELLIEPLVAEGRLVFRREPATLVFEVERPLATRIHVQARSYQVYRPAEGVAERFVFEAHDMWDALLACFSFDGALLAKWFVTASATRAEGVTTLVLVPRRETTKRYLRKLRLEIDDEASTVKRLVYTDAAGDEVEVALSAHVEAPELDDPEAFFSLKLPASVRIDTVRVEAREE